MRLCCTINRIPSPIRLTFGIALWIIGLPVFVLPIPLGLIFLSFGTVFVLGVSEAAKEKLGKQTIRWPRLHSVIRQLLERCPNCLEK